MLYFSPMNCLIVDDNALASLTLKQMASPLQNITIVGECQNAIDAFNFLKTNSVDVLFLDIEMPDMSGLDLVKSLTSRPIIIFTTSQKKYAAEAFELSVADYLIKPISPQRLLQAISKAEDLLLRKNSEVSSVASDSIFIKENKSLIKINTADILWIEAMGDYVKIKVQKKWHIVHSSLRQLEEKLDTNLFVRVHRSYIISINKVESFEDGNINIEGTSIPVADTYKASFLDKINLL